MWLGRHEPREATEEVLARSGRLRRELAATAEELEGFVRELLDEVDRLHGIQDDEDRMPP